MWLLGKYEAPNGLQNTQSRTRRDSKHNLKILTRRTYPEILTRRTYPETLTRRTYPEILSLTWHTYLKKNIATGMERKTCAMPTQEMNQESVYARRVYEHMRTVRK